MSTDQMRVEPFLLDKMRVACPGARWAAYRNQALDSELAGHLQFMAFGPGCTHTFPTEQFPADTSFGAGWKYRFCGVVDLGTGTVKEMRLEDLPR